MESSTNKRRITKEQKMYLVQYMEEHREFSHERFFNDSGVHSLAEQWSSLAISLNAVGGALKDADGWKRAWINIRSKAKQKSQDLKNILERSEINSSVPNQRLLTELDERVIGVMTTIAVVGQEEVGEPLRNIGLVPTANVFLRDQEDDANEDLEYTVDATVTNEVRADTPNINSPTPPTPPPYIPRQAEKRRKMPTLEESNFKLLKLEEQNLCERQNRNALLKTQINLMEQKNKILLERNAIMEKANNIEADKVAAIKVLISAFTQSSNNI